MKHEDQGAAALVNQSVHRGVPQEHQTREHAKRPGDEQFAKGQEQPSRPQKTLNRSKWRAEQGRPGKGMSNGW